MNLKKPDLESMLPIVLIILSIILSSYVFVDNSFSSSPFMYEETETFIAANNLIATGNIIYQNEYTDINKYFDYPVAALTYSYWNKELNASVPTRAIGNYYFLAYSIIFFGSNFALIYSIVFIVSGFIFGYCTSEILSYFGFVSEKKKTVIIASFLYLSFAPFIIWANTWFDYTPALFYFVMALYFMSKYVNTPKVIFAILSSVFLGASFLYRFEYLIFAASLSTIYFFKNEKKVLVYTYTILFFFMITLLSLNNNLYGSPFTTGYSSKNHVVSVLNNDLLLESSRTSLGLLDKIVNVYLVDFLSPNITHIISNLTKFLINPFSAYVLLFCMAIFSIYKFGNKKTYRYLVVVSSVLIFWAYYVFSGNFWGINNPTWIVNVYYRYSFPLFIFLLMGCTLGILNMNKNKKNILLIVLFVVLLLANNISVLLTSEYGLTEISNESKTNFELNNNLKNITEENALIWAPFYEKTILGRYVLSPWYILKSNEVRPDYVLNYTQKLLELEYPVYYVSAPWHKSTYLNLDRKFSDDSRFNLIEMSSTKKYTIYKIVLKEKS